MIAEGAEGEGDRVRCAKRYREGEREERVGGGPKSAEGGVGRVLCAPLRQSARRERGRGRGKGIERKGQREREGEGWRERTCEEQMEREVGGNPRADA
eukprot:scaffold57505_cov31-Tisochrysis_lutea.AAC.2